MQAEQNLGNPVSHQKINLQKIIMAFFIIKIMVVFSLEILI